MQWESPTSELHLSHLERKRGSDQAEGVREFRKPSKTQIIVWDVRDHSSPGCYQWWMAGRRLCSTRIAEIEEASWNEEEARGLCQSDPGGSKAMCHIAVIIYSKYFSVCDLPLNRNRRRCKLSCTRSKHKVLPVGKLQERVSRVWETMLGRAQLFELHLLFFFFKYSGFRKVTAGDG